MNTTRTEWKKNTYQPRNSWSGRFNRINGVDWYPRLYGKEDASGRRLVGLLDEVRSSDLAKGLIVSWELPERENSPGRCFALFSAFPDFLAFQEGVAQADRCFYEVVLGQREQKPHFDLDLSEEHLGPLCDLAAVDGWLVETLPQLGDLLTRCLMLACQQACQAKGLKLFPELDFLVFATPGAAKVSHHLVLPRHRHVNNKEAKSFYHRVLESPAMGSFRKYSALGTIIDGAVYSKTQQFRLPGSHKRERQAVKELVNPFSWGLGPGGEREREVIHLPLESPRNVRHLRLMLFASSLLSFGAESSTLPSFRTEEEAAAEERKELRKSQNGDFPPLGDSDIDQALALAAATLGHFPFDLIGVQANCLLLRRLAPSACPLCQGRVHQTENPYLMIGGRNVYWVCRRSVDRGFAPRLALGCLGMPSLAALGQSGLKEEIVEENSEESGQINEGIGQAKRGLFFQLPEGYEYDDDYEEPNGQPEINTVSKETLCLTVENVVDNLEQRSEQLVENVVDNLEQRSEQLVENVVDNLERRSGQLVENVVDNLEQRSEQPVEKSAEQRSEQLVEKSVQPTAQPTIKTVPQATIKSVPQPAQPTIKKVPQPAQPTIKTVPQPAQPTIKKVPQPAQPTIKTVPQPAQPTIKKVPQPAQPTIKTVPQPAQPTIKTVPQPAQPVQPTIKTVPQPTIKTVPQPAQLAPKTVQQPSRPQSVEGVKDSRPRSGEGVKDSRPQSVEGVKDSRPRSGEGVKDSQRQMDRTFSEKIPTPNIPNTKLKDEKTKSRPTFYAPSRPEVNRDGYEKIKEMQRQQLLQKSSSGRNKEEETDALFVIDKACLRHIAGEGSGVKGVTLCEEPLPPKREKENKKKGRKKTSELIDSLDISKIF